MQNWSISISLGSGAKGQEWDRIIRQQAKKNRMSVGYYLRQCVFEKVKLEQQAADGSPKNEQEVIGNRVPEVVTEAPAQ